MVDILKRALRMTSVGRQRTVLDFQRDVGRPDEADNHLIELPFAAGAQAIVTHNIRDVGRGELRWQTLEVLTPAQFLERYP